MNALKAKLLTYALNPIFWRGQQEEKLSLQNKEVEQVQKDRIIYGKRNTKTNRVGIIGIADIYADWLFFCNDRRTTGYDSWSCSTVRSIGRIRHARLSDVTSLEIVNFRSD